MSSRCAKARSTNSTKLFSRPQRMWTGPSFIPSPSSLPVICRSTRSPGPPGKLFHPMAETMSFALVGALILTLTLIPVLASYWFKGGVTREGKPLL